MPAPPIPKFRIMGVAGNADSCNQLFRLSLAGEGPVAVADNHLFVAWLPSLPVHSPGFRRFDMRRIMYCLVAHLSAADDVKAVNIAWFPLPRTIAAILKALARAGIPLAPLSDEAALRDLLAEWIPKISVTARTLTAASIYRVAVPTNYVGEITTGFVLGSDPVLARFVELILLLPGIWVCAPHRPQGLCTCV